MNRFSKEIPIFFSTDDNYIPFLDVAISSLIENASKDKKYRLVILNTGLKPENVSKIKLHESEMFAIDFFDISNELEEIRKSFKDVYHFSVVTYYRLFIASLFPQYDKIVYLDCDLVVLGDVSELYGIDLGGNIMSASQDQFVQGTAEFKAYTKKAIGVDPEKYINAGVLVVDLEQFRKHEIEKKFVEIITEYDFDLVDPDQACLNYLCRDLILPLPTCWNRVPNDQPDEEKPNIVHYALYKKPWQDEAVRYGEYFWKYAERSPFYAEILKRKSEFGDAERAQSEEAAMDIVKHAAEIADSDYTFVHLLDKN